MKSTFSPLLLSSCLSLIIPHISASGTVQLDLTRKRGDVVDANGIRRREVEAVDAPLTEPQNFIGYAANITIGTPPQDFEIHLDTGSGDLWVVAKDAVLVNVASADTSGFPATYFDYQASSTFNDLNITFEDSYVDGTAVKGMYFTDTLGVGGASLSDYQMGLATNTTLVSGIMGISFASEESAAGTNQTYPNIVDTMVTQNLISSHAYSLWLNDINAHSGSILFGGVDTAKYTGDLGSIQMFPYSVTSQFQSLIVAFTSLSLTSSTGTTTVTPDGYGVPAILDSGTTPTVLPDELARAIYAITGAVWVEEYQSAITPCAMASQDATINFEFGGSIVIQVPISEIIYEVIVNGTSNADITGVPDGYCMFNFVPLSSTGSSTSILFGDSFLRSAYVVYDFDNERIALAQTKYNSTDSNIVPFASLSAAIPSATTVSEPSYTFAATGPAFPSNSISTFVGPTTSFSGAAGKAFTTYSSAIAALQSAAAGTGGIATVTSAASPTATSKKSAAVAGMPKPFVWEKVTFVGLIMGLLMW